MPVKTPSRKTHHTTHKKEKRTKHFLKVYAPYIPLMLIVACGIFVSFHRELQGPGGAVQGYATHVSNAGLLSATNKQRAEQGLPTLSSNSQLQAAAQAKAQDMVDKNYWSHETPDGREPWVFIQGQQYQYRKAAENLAYGFASDTAIVGGWMNSASHRSNVLDKDVSQIGFGIVNTPNFQNKGPETVVVALYAQPAVLGTATVPPIETASDTQRSIPFIQSVAGDKAPWSSFVIGLVIGSLVMYLVVTHARGVRRALITSERFAIRHPVFDMTMIALVALAVIVSQSIGTIY